MLYRPKTARTWLTSGFASAAVVLGLAAPAGATVSGSCQRDGSVSIELCVYQEAPYHVNYGVDADNPKGKGQIKVSSYRVRATSLDPSSVADLRLRVRSVVNAPCVSGCGKSKRLSRVTSRTYEAVRSGKDIRMTVPWSKATTTVDQSGKAFQAGNAELTYAQRGRTRTFQSDNVCAGLLRFAQFGKYGFCSAP